MPSCSYMTPEQCARMREVRETLYLSLKAVALTMGYSISEVSYMERGLRPCSSAQAELYWQALCSLSAPLP
jgi:transcriptional regulator with XRE-family HTH domain